MEFFFLEPLPCSWCSPATASCSRCTPAAAAATVLVARLLLLLLLLFLSLACCWPALRSHSLFVYLSLIFSPRLLLPLPNSPPLSKTHSFHIPGMSKEMLDAAARTRRPEQALVGVSMESAPNYPLLADREFMGRFDLLATLEPPPGGDGDDGDRDKARSSSSPPPKRIWYPYYDDMFRRCWEAEGNPAPAGGGAAAAGGASSSSSSSSSSSAAASAKSSTTPSKPSLHPSHLRENALAYVNSNCATKTGRDELVKAMAEVLEPLGVPLR